VILGGYETGAGNVAGGRCFVSNDALDRGRTGFLRMLNTVSLGFADFRANRQNISTCKVLLFLMDYASQRRLKIWAEAEVSDDPSIAEKLADNNYGVTIDRDFLFRVLVFEWHCQ
jgi:uncharacterized protein